MIVLLGIFFQSSSSWEVGPYSFLWFFIYNLTRIIGQVPVHDVLNDYSSSGKYMERKSRGFKAFTVKAKSKSFRLRVTIQSAPACSKGPDLSLRHRTVPMQFLDKG